MSWTINVSRAADMILRRVTQQWNWLIRYYVSGLNFSRCRLNRLFHPKNYCCNCVVNIPQVVQIFYHIFIYRTAFSDFFPSSTRRVTVKLKVSVDHEHTYKCKSEYFLALIHILSHNYSSAKKIFLKLIIRSKNIYRTGYCFQFGLSAGKS